MDAHQRLTRVGRTALGVAAARAAESRRPDRLFDDPLAAAFVRAAGGLGSLWVPRRQGTRVWRAMGDYLAIRTRFFDEFLMGACAAGCWQVVLLAAGLDTRAFRLPWPDGVRLLELDRPDVLDFKEAVLATEAAQPACERVVVPADLAGDWPADLVRVGFRARQPTAWLAEGLLIYLPEDVGNRMLASLSELSAPRSRLGAECTGRAMLSAPDMATALHGAGRNAVAALSSLWRGAAIEDPVAWLARFGWLARDHRVAELAADYGRPVPPAFAPDHPHAARGGLVLADRASHRHPA